MKRMALQLYGANECKDETTLISEHGSSYAHQQLTEIEDAHNNGWKIIMLIDSDMLNKERSYFGCLTNYH